VCAVTIMTLSVWQAAPASGGMTNFGLSYEVTKVKNAFTAETETVPACDGTGTSCAAAFKIYRGTSIMHRTKWVAKTSIQHDGKVVNTMVKARTIDRSLARSYYYYYYYYYYYARTHTHRCVVRS
jgi:hypothetical protein